MLFGNKIEKHERFISSLIEPIVKVIKTYNLDENTKLKLMEVKTSIESMEQISGSQEKEISEQIKKFTNLLLNCVVNKNYVLLDNYCEQIIEKIRKRDFSDIIQKPIKKSAEEFDINSLIARIKNGAGISPILLREDAMGNVLNELNILLAKIQAIYVDNPRKKSLFIDKELSKITAATMGLSTFADLKKAVSEVVGAIDENRSKSTAEPIRTNNDLLNRTLEKIEAEMVRAAAAYSDLTSQSNLNKESLAELEAYISELEEEDPMMASLIDEYKYKSELLGSVFQDTFGSTNSLSNVYRQIRDYIHMTLKQSNSEATASDLCLMFSDKTIDRMISDHDFLQKKLNELLEYFCKVRDKGVKVQSVPKNPNINTVNSGEKPILSDKNKEILAKIKAKQGVKTANANSQSPTYDEIISKSKSVIDKLEN